MNVFGPGRGESCVVHLGNDEWIIVDSCRDQRTGITAPIQYLTALGVDVARQVKLVIATHAHDDHIAGISEVFEACEDAHFVLPTALTREEFAALVEIDREATKDLRKKNFAEYRKVRELVRRRGAGGVNRARYALESRELYSRAAGSTSGAVVRSLSPSDHAFEATIQKFSDYLPAANSEVSPPAQDPNELAVAVWVEVGNHRALLGADLLTGPAGCGWDAVLETFAPTAGSSFYKVAHHGSHTADHPDVWNDLLLDNPVAVLAPYRARYIVPNESEIRALRTHTERLYATADPKLPAASKSTKRAAATLGQLAKNVREPWGSLGHVRARALPGADWRVELFGPARVLS